MIPVRIGYKTIDIKFIENPMADCVGMYKRGEGKIFIDQSLSPDEKLNTIIHELLHAVYHLYGLPADDDTEERYVNTLANGITEVILRNPKLLQHLKALIDAQEQGKIGRYPWTPYACMHSTGPK